MDGPSDGDDRSEDDPFEWDDPDSGNGPRTATGKREADTPTGDDGAGRGSTGFAGADDRASVSAGDDSEGLVDVDWSPRREDATVPTRVWAVCVAIGLGVAGFLVALFVFPVASFFLSVAEVGELSFIGDLIVQFLVLQGVSFPLVALGYLRFRGYSLSYLGIDLPDLWDVAWVVGGFLLVIALVMGVIIAISVTNAPQAERTDTEGFQENPDAILLMIPISILLIGPAEELLFRGVIQTRLRETFGPVGAIVFANFGFAPLHVFALTGSPAALAITIGALFVPGLVFGIAYEATGNLVVPSLIHGLYNATIFTTFYLGTTATLL